MSTKKGEKSNSAQSIIDSYIKNKKPDPRPLPSIMKLNKRSKLSIDEKIADNIDLDEEEVNTNQKTPEEGLPEGNSL